MDREAMMSYLKLPIERYTPTELVTMCPFHKETEASFFINLKKKVYHCFSCDAKGTIEELIIHQRKVGFFKARELLREWGGVDKEIQVTENTTVESDLELYQKNGWEEYLKGRGFDTKKARKYGIRYYLDEHAIVFPIRDNNFKLVGFKFRKIEEKKFWYSKGINKNNYLYGEVYLKNNKEVILVEGELDAIKINQFGNNAVALLGRELSEKHEELLIKYDKVILCLDNDRVGRQSTKKILIKLKGKVDLYYIDLLGVKDPAECNKEHWDKCYNNMRNIK